MYPTKKKVSRVIIYRDEVSRGKGWKSEQKDALALMEEQNELPFNDVDEYDDSYISQRRGE
jgi:tRNA(Ile2) C34 agmatinyltransferase TiaS